MRLLALGASLVLTLGVAAPILGGTASAATPTPSAAASASTTTSPTTAPSATSDATSGAASGAASGEASDGASGSSSSGVLSSLLPSASTTPGTSTARTSSKSSSASASKSSASAGGATGKFHPKEGALFNDPLNRGPYHDDTIRKDAIRAISSAPPGSVIHIAMFNFKSVNYLHALIKAHQRGVQVQFLMCACNNTKALNNPQPAQLRAELKKGNSKLPVAQRSWVRECRGSCRGTRGINHYKFIAFSAVGAGSKPVPDVVMYGSNNATEVAVHRQWNDWFTYTRNARLYNDACSKTPTTSL